MGADNQQGRTEREAGNYIAGFVDGEGSFSVTIQRTKNVRLGIQIIPEFHVCQHRNRTEVLTFIHQKFKCGYVKPNHRKNPNDLTWVFVVRDIRNLREKVIPYFEKYPLLAKANDFQKFKIIVAMMDKKLHLTSKGLMQILKVAFSMNSSGKYRKLSLRTLLASL